MKTAQTKLAVPTWEETFSKTAEIASTLGLTGITTLIFPLGVQLVYKSFTNNFSQVYWT